MSDSRLFQPLKVGNTTLSHRMAMAPLTRFRADDDHIPTPKMVTYYAQRASVPGTLLITEGTFIAPAAGGMANVPGIYNAAQIAAWRTVTDAVHARGSAIFCQLWALGRAALAPVAAAEGFAVRSSSAVALAGGATPAALTRDEIREVVGWYAAAARNAIAAGFDGVEVHGANGYLVDQFLQDTCNQRGDEYGGSVENRSRFAVEVVTAVVEAVGAERTGLRLSPWGTFQEMRMADPVPQFEDVIRKVAGIGKLAYLHLVRAVVWTSDTKDGGVVAEDEGLEFAARIWDGPLLIAGGLTPETARTLVDDEFKDKNVVAVFGRHFISTPDLPFRAKEGIELTPYNRNTFYIPKSPEGYIDQPFSKEFEAVHGVQAAL
ncbi:FMN-linked oxidoreductase [Trichocladium antarcticum]|uniref:FMN-linked oxidoreductase n=1 Tax=Trichocladium antarcticum TaxID=1450529 RepID=A0AAN6ZDP0_9PEZI|nr:FMN-linked oxidoreductase [Trichocladium antarcticum]